MTQAPSTAQSRTHWSGGGDVVAPCSSRSSSPCSAFCRASSPAVESCGATPSRHTWRQVSIAVSPRWGDRLGDVWALEGRSTLFNNYTFEHFSCQCEFGKKTEKKTVIS